MKKFKKALLVTASAISLSAASAGADLKSDKLPVVSDFEVKLSAYADFQVGHRNQTGLVDDEKNVSSNRKSFAFYNSSALIADVSNKANDATYGGRVVLVPTSQRKATSSYNGSHIYIATDYGRVEAGSPFLPSCTMLVDGSDNAAATFDDWTRYANLSSNHLTQGVKPVPSFAVFAEFFLDSKLVTANLPGREYSSEPARSIVYYTPKFDLTKSTKMQVGVSFTPDSSNTGADNADTNSSGVDTRLIENTVAGAVVDGGKFEIDRTVKDSFTAGINLEQNITDGVDLKIGLTGEYGKSAGEAKRFATSTDTTPTATFKLSDLRTYNIGAVLNVGSFSYAASYGSLGKSLTTPEFHKTGRDTSYYTGTVGYKQGPFAVSASYFKSEQFKNEVDAVSIGTHYQLAPGFQPYAEISNFTVKGKSEFRPELDKKKSRGTIAIIGAKLSL